MSKVLVACEFSGVVRDAFQRAGHSAWSCDLLPTESTAFPIGMRHHNHHQCDVRDVLYLDPEWDLMIAHPPCTRLAVSGARYFKGREAEQSAAADFFMQLAHANIARICIENPVGVMSTRWRKPDQYIQPWQFGHGETKKTGLWLKGLPPLTPSHVVPGRSDRIHKMPETSERWKHRSRTYTGIAEAMAQQWGALLT